MPDTRTSFTGKTILITGAGSGMGRSHAELFAGRGGNVIVHDINGYSVEEAVAAK